MSMRDIAIRRAGRARARSASARLFFGVSADFTAFGENPRKVSEFFTLWEFAAVPLTITS